MEARHGAAFDGWVLCARLTSGVLSPERCVASNSPESSRTLELRRKAGARYNAKSVPGKLGGRFLLCAGLVLRPAQQAMEIGRGLLGFAAMTEAADCVRTRVD